jgi:serine/threonine-protein kinase
MDPERWQAVREIFRGALERQAEARPRYLDGACDGDGELRAEVESLLDAHRDAGGFLDPGAGGPDPGPPASDPPGPETADEDAEGRRVGAWQLSRRIGSGGMGTVYLASRADAAFDKRVAVKLLHGGADSDEIVRRFRVERQILAGLDHSNIARLLDGGSTEDGRPYLVMEYVDGQPIDRYCDAHELSVEARVRLFRKVCDAVRFAHRNLVVHRDLKPSNILVGDDGEPKLLDFGIAKILDPAGGLEPTLTAQRAMTPGYASPEQLLGKPITTASDVFSLGVLLYLLLTGKKPFGIRGGSPIEALWAAREATTEPPSVAVSEEPDPPPEPPKTDREARRRRRAEVTRRRRRLEGDLDNIVLMALRKEPDRRYASVEQLSDDLGRHLDGLPVRARGDSPGYRVGKFVRRYPFAVAATAALVLAILGFGVVMAVQRNQIAAERDRAEAQRQATEIERRRAEEVTAFLVGLFEGSDPFVREDASDLDARELLDRAARRLAGELETTPGIRAELEHTIAVIYRRLGLPDAAEPLLASSLEARRRAFGGDHPKIAESVAEKAALLADRGDYKAAAAMHRQALDMRLRHLGPDHGDVADSLGSLAALAHAEGGFDEAEDLYHRTLTIQRRLGDGARTADTLRRLALTVQSLGDYPRAESLFREALEIFRRRYGDDHLQVATTRLYLGHLLVARGDVDPAEAAYREALEGLHRAFGDEHVEIANCLHSLAWIHNARGHRDQAETLYREALEMLRQLRGDGHPELAPTLGQLAGVLKSQGDLDGAERLYRQALDIRRKSLGTESPYLVIHLTDLAQLQLDKSQLAKAEATLDEALAIGRKAFPRGHWRISYAEGVLAECRIAAGRHPEAERLLLDAYAVLSELKGEKAPVTLHTLRRLVILYESWEKPEDAERYRTELARLSSPEVPPAAYE